VSSVSATGSAADFLPPRVNLTSLRQAVQGCRGCELALGATAARALLGSDFRVTRQRGRFVPSGRAEYVTATVHPSSVLRAPGSAARRAAREEFVGDLRLVAGVLDASGQDHQLG